MDAAEHTPKHPAGTVAAADIERIGAAIDAARAPAGATPALGSAEFLAALAQLRAVRENLAAWEPELIDAARAHGASWAQLAPALGLASRQAAERRALRLRPSTQADTRTGDERVTAERDRRAGQKAAAGWARDHAADLRQLAGQLGALTDLPDAVHTALHTALAGPDAADLLAPLTDARTHLHPGHHAFAARIDTITDHTATLRRDARDRRHPTD
ncbi:HSP18 transcriptional regulator [Actinospica sp.]|jgi:hypothetical protein|uniref:HSP18 transcriptional regulator n=1 Tax=Actinospica sp. TaxID=1872142 RepID=UPI002CBABF02|nr:HSP18 transcriptional regulator [Actinospica sp.]HWG27159.1 HSP18 transcriptional regulator [Actinospica sp.]